LSLFGINPNQALNQTDYRAEIDGLRAIAVLSVVLFHLNESFLPGGFVGVDIFFVISGYLISKHILSDVTSSRFSFKNFYLKRARRILPALYGVISYTVILSVFLLVPEDIKSTARSALAAIFYKANYHFAKDVDYFAPITRELPLLHLWSLSVEEQFYFIFPIILVLIAKPKALRENYKKYVLGALIAIFLASVLSAEYGLNQDQLKKWTFYSLTSRASELLIGAFLAVTNIKIYNKFWAEVFAAVGLIALAGSLIFINQQMRFPGLIAMIPCLATACIILAHGQCKTNISKILTLKPMVFFGLISYSLYLYHWPLIAFFKYSTEDATSKFFQAGFIFIASVILAYLSWRYIELRFRKPSGDSANKALVRIFLIPTLCLFGSLHLVIHIQGRLPFIDYKKMEKTLHFLDLEKYCHNRFDEKTCVFGDLKHQPEILLLGDSHAGHYQAFLEEIGKAKGFSFVARSFDGCAPLALFNKEALNKLKIKNECEDQIVWASKNFNRFQTIIFAGAWTRYFDPKVFTPEMENLYEEQISIMLSEISSQKKKIFFFDQIPLCPGLDDFYGRKFSLRNTVMNETEERKKVIASCGSESNRANLHFKQLVEKNGAQFVSTLADFQNQVGPMPFYEDLYLYKDGGHLNEEGSIFLGKWTGENSETFKNLFRK
jgi:peptidoglycan/LPS O-acetylase OafA/YrhL